MGITYRHDLIQKTDEWLDARRGLITASTIKHIMTPTGKTSNNDKTRAHLYDLAAQRISGHIEAAFVSDDMLRGELDEVEAVKLYATHVAPVQECGLVYNDDLGFQIAYSPDGLVGDDGLIEIKSRRQKYHVQTIIEHAADGATIPDEYVLQCQSALMITGRKWLDFLSYCGGMPMVPIRIYPDPIWHEKIAEAITAAETRVKEIVASYHAAIDRQSVVIETERVEHGDMMI